jgi:hypothetical protein
MGGWSLTRPSTSSEPRFPRLPQKGARCHPVHRAHCGGRWIPHRCPGARCLEEPEAHERGARGGAAAQPLGNRPPQKLGALRPIQACPLPLPRRRRAVAGDCRGGVTARAPAGALGNTCPGGGGSAAAPPPSTRSPPSGRPWSLAPKSRLPWEADQLRFLLRIWVRHPPNGPCSPSFFDKWWMGVSLCALFREESLSGPDAGALTGAARTRASDHPVIPS